MPVTPAENLRGAELVQLVLGDETLPTDTGRLAAEARPPPAAAWTPAST